MFILELCLTIFLLALIFPVFFSFFLHVQRVFVLYQDRLVRQSEWIYIQTVIQDDAMAAISFKPPFQFYFDDYMIEYQCRDGVLYRQYPSGRSLRLTRFLFIESVLFVPDQMGYLFVIKDLGELFMPVLLPSSIWFCLAFLNFGLDIV